MLTPAPDTIDKLPLWENDIRRDHAQEHAALYNGQGKLVAFRSGSINEVEFTPEELGQCKGGTLSHNHPKGKPPSKNDLTLCLAWGVTVRATGVPPGDIPYTYILTPHAKSAAFSDEIARVWDTELSRANYYLTKYNVKDTDAGLERRARHMTLRALQTRFPFVYASIPHRAVTEMRTHSAHRVAIFTENEKNLDDFYAHLRASIRGWLLKYTKPDGHIDVASRNRLKDAVNREVTQAFLGRPLPDKTIKPFVVNSKGVLTPNSPYMDALWRSMTAAVGLAAAEQRSIVEHVLPNTLKTKIKAYTKIPRIPSKVSEGGNEAQQYPPKYDPPHTWVDPQGYRLSDRIWDVTNETRRKLDLFLDDEIGGDRDSLSISSDLEQFLNPGRVLNRTNKPYGNSASFDGMRLARTEIAASATRAQHAAAMVNSLVTQYRVVTSSRHKCCDECDEAVAGGPYDKDDTEYLPPIHPQCMCTVRWIQATSHDDLISRLQAMLGCEELSDEEETQAEEEIAGFQSLLSDDNSFTNILLGVVDVLLGA